MALKCTVNAVILNELRRALVSFETIEANAFVKGRITRSKLLGATKERGAGCQSPKRAKTLSQWAQVGFLDVGAGGDG